MSDESFIAAGAGHTTFVGPDATQLFAATVLRSAIDLYIKTGLRANRAYTPSAMLAAASRITGKAYKRNGLPQASADLTVWIEAMKSALPVVADASDASAAVVSIDTAPRDGRKIWLWWGPGERLVERRAYWSSLAQAWVDAGDQRTVLQNVRWWTGA